MVNILKFGLRNFVNFTARLQSLSMYYPTITFFVDKARRFQSA